MGSQEYSTILAKITEYRKQIEEIYTKNNTDIQNLRSSIVSTMINEFTKSSITNVLFNTSSFSNKASIIFDNITDITTIYNDINSDITDINNEFTSLIDNITKNKCKYNNDLLDIDNTFESTSGSISRYNDSLEIYNFILLENILYIIGILGLIYKMIEWNINISL